MGREKGAFYIFGMLSRLGRNIRLLLVFVRFIDIKTGEYETRIINKNK